MLRLCFAIKTWNNLSFIAVMNVEKDCVCVRERGYKKTINITKCILYLHTLAFDFTISLYDYPTVQGNIYIL